MNKLPFLKAGDSVEIIAPASRCSLKQLNDLSDLVISWGLHCIVNENIFGDDLLCANSDEVRFRLLSDALHYPETKALICARGGYGSMRLIPELTKISPPSSPKLFIGMSDITALNLFLQQEWQWPVVHGSLVIDKLTKESIACMRSLLFGESTHIELRGMPLNEMAKKNNLLQSTLTGGNLTLVQASIGMIWEIKANNKIIFLEEVDERGYRIDRMLTHLSHTNVFKEAKAIVFGDFLGGLEPNQTTSLVNPVLERFAHSCEIPVIRIEGVGHGPVNFPLMMGTPVSLRLGDHVSLTSCH